MLKMNILIPKGTCMAENPPTDQVWWLMRPVGETERPRKKKHCCKLAICPDHPRRWIKIQFCVWVALRG